MQDPCGGFPVFSFPVRAAAAGKRKKEVFWGEAVGTYLHFPLSNAIILRFILLFLKTTTMEDIP
jgi:hypothetical protein